MINKAFERSISAGKTLRTMTELRVYMLIGALSTSVDLGAYFIITRFILPGSDAVYIKSASFILGSICSFFMNRRFTFDAKERPCLGQVGRFYAMVLVSFLINSGVFFASHELLGINDLVSAAIALSFSFSAGFTLSKLWVFKTSSI